MPTYSRHIIIVTVLTASYAVGCRTRTAAPTLSTDPVKGVAQDDTHPAACLEVAEAVFRHQFDHNASGGQRNVEYFFISLEKSDPPEVLLAKFANEKPRVLPASLATSSAGEGVRHKESGGRGLIFRISSIKWLDENTAEVEGGYYEGGLSSSGNVYKVERRGGKWSVTNDEMQWIS